MFLLISLHSVDQHGSSCCGSLELLPGSYDSKVNPSSSLTTEKLAEAVLLYVFNIAFPAFLFCQFCNFGKGLIDTAPDVWL